jgi:2-polyprenyl-3-methyl-5-hydroxy-6-metoxy-1,4-benzoquinol methylase
MNCPVCEKEFPGNSSKRHFDTIEKKEYHILTCLICGASFSKPMRNPGAEWYKQYNEYFGYKSEHDKTTYTFQQQCKCLQLLLPDFSNNKPSLLDIGCGKGDFLQAAKEIGYNAHGIDFDCERVKTAQDKTSFDSVECIDGENCLKDYDRRFDLITFFQVLEHIATPNQFLKDVNQLLNPEGYIIFHVPNANRIFPTALGISDLPPHHLTRFTNYSLTQLLDKNGFKVINTFNNYYPLRLFYINAYIAMISNISTLFKSFKNRLIIPGLENTNSSKSQNVKISKLSLFQQAHTLLKKNILAVIRFFFTYVLLFATGIFVYPFLLYLRNHGRGLNLFLIAKKK